jgi:hypothetical protein
MAFNIGKNSAIIIPDPFCRDGPFLGSRTDNFDNYSEKQIFIGPITISIGKNK